MLVADPAALLPPEERAAVTATVLDNNPGMAEDTAGRIVDQALAFVATAARNPLVPIAPSRTVDEGWHALVLHTAVYARLCDRLGVFVHHYPERPDTARQGPDVIERTVVLMLAEGFVPDAELWMPPSDTSVPVAASCGHSPKCGPIEPQPSIALSALV
ncbi:glycine-rich domain-containing protein [Streptomyces sp. NRRL F-5123]|uniref:glycine-rich domain-containing protein n=1 Tax=Streptomyces sp. NRRL F-5123 TaxID=1463856 RepID=UPI0005BB4028|nr:hypothetical protein [Streptomyces sp. NRRL F-5123]